MLDDAQKEQNDIQYKNLMLLLTFNREVIEKVLKQYVMFIIVLFMITYVLKTI